MKKLIKIIIWIAFVGGLSYLGYKQLEKNKAKIEEDAQLTQQKDMVMPVITTKVDTAIWEGRYEVVGDFAPYKQVTVMSEAAGKIVKLNFDNGSYVKEGTTLLAIDNDLLQIQLKTTKTNLKKAESDFNRLNKLLGDGGITQQQLDDAKLAIDNLNTKAESIDKQISMTFVHAPISGVISHKMVEKGSLVAPSMQIANITNIDRLKLQVHLSEEQIITVLKGQTTTLVADILPDQKMTGKVTFIDVNAGIGKRYLVEIEIPNRNGKLKSGMTATAFFDGGNSMEVLAISRESVVGNLRNAKVYLVEDGKALLRSIKTGLVFGNKIQVKSGLKAGDTIVVSGQINLEDGMEVSVASN